MFAIGVIVPMVITSNRGFNLLDHKPCEVRDVVLETLEPASTYLLHNAFVLDSLITVSSMLLDI
jgi:hypothetical protein